MDRLIVQVLRLLFLGTGDAEQEDTYAPTLMGIYGNRMAAHIRFDVVLSHRMYASYGYDF